MDKDRQVLRGQSLEDLADRMANVTPGSGIAPLNVEIGGAALLASSR
jgi:hypothetical protein